MSMRIGGQNIDILRVKAQIFDIQVNIDTLIQRKNSLINQLAQMLVKDQEELKQEKKKDEPKPKDKSKPDNKLPDKRK